MSNDIKPLRRLWHPNRYLTTFALVEQPLPPTKECVRILETPINDVELMLCFNPIIVSRDTPQTRRYKYSN